MSQSWFQVEVAEEALTVAKVQLEYLGLRALPFLIYGAFARRLGPGRRAGFGLLLLGLAIACSFWPWYALRLLSDLAALSYYVCAACLVALLEPACASGLLRRDATFALCLSLFVFVPATFFGLFAAIPMLAFGWCVTLSAYSYCIEARRAGARGLQACLFFLLVDPALVYAERARPDACATAGAPPLRLVVGFLRMLVATLAIALLVPFATASMHTGTPLLRYASTMLATLPAFIALYWLRAGFADIQVGLTRVVGHTVGECFDRPYLARSPSEFWRRWNMYVGHWAQRYIFAPLSLRLARWRRRSRSGTSVLELDKALSVFGTFLALGLLHDVLNYAGESMTQFVFVRTFAFAAIALSAWDILGKLVGVSSTGMVAVLWGRVFSRIYLAHYVVCLVVFSGALG
jgi:hypothetical protein